MTVGVAVQRMRKGAGGGPIGVTLGAADVVCLSEKSLVLALQSSKMARCNRIPPKAIPMKPQHRNMRLALMIIRSIMVKKNYRGDR